MHFVRHNSVIVGDIYGIDEKDKIINFVDIRSDNIWYGDPLEIIDTISEDGVAFFK